jgi:hypothetical protein
MKTHCFPDGGLMHQEGTDHITDAVLVGSDQCSVEKTAPWSLHAKPLKGESRAIDVNTHKALTPNVVATVTYAR